MLNNKNTIITTVEKEPDSKKELVEKLKRIQSSENKDFFEKTKNKNNHNGGEESTNPTPTPPSNIHNTTSNSSITTSSESTAVPVDMPSTSTVSHATTSNINAPRRRIGTIFQDLNDEARIEILARQERARIFERDLPPQDILENPPQQEEYDFEEVNRLADRVQANVAHRIPLRHQADIEYGLLLRGYRNLIESTRQLVYELANFSWNHPMIATGSLVAVSGIIMVIFRNRTSVNIIRGLTNNSPINAITGLLPSNGTVADTVNRAAVTNTLTTISQTGGIIYFIRLLFIGVRHSR